MTWSALAAAGLALTACGSTSTPSGQAAQGAEGDAGPVAVRNVVIVLGPEGSSSATVVLTAVNSSSTDDALTGVEVADTQPSSTSITGGQIALPPGKTVSVGYSGDSHVNLYDYEPAAGRLVPVTLVFHDNGRLVLSVKVVPPTGPYASIAPSPSAAPSS
jgi:copper(I)-binding protein